MSFKIEADLIAAQNLVPRLTVVAFGNFVASEALLDLFGGGEKVAITIAGPAARVFDIASDEFALAGFAAARRQAKAKCERLPA